MKEDILEQLVDEYLKHKGYFTNHNIKFKPSKNHIDYIQSQDSVNSDIDVLAIHPQRNGPEKVLAVNCKSWQSGLTPARKIIEIEQGKVISGRKAWKSFRELYSHKWSEAFIEKISSVTGSDGFTHVTAVTKINGDKATWETHQPFTDRLRGAPVSLMSLNEILDDMYPSIQKTPAPSNVGRLLQIIKASGWINR